MITIGLVAELRHIAKELDTNIDLKFKLKDAYMEHPLEINIENGMMNLFYQNNLIWREDITSEISMFGLESVHVIADIIRMMDTKQGNWQSLKYIEE